MLDKIKQLSSKLINKTFILFTVALGIVGCSFSSRDTFDLAYQDRKLIQTLQTGPFYSIAPDGSYSTLNYNVWDFDTAIMEVTYSEYRNSLLVSSSQYAFEVTEDIDFTSGVLRLSGDGVLNDQFVGVSAETNNHGAFIKLAISPQRGNIVNTAINKPSWEFVSKPILFILNSVYENIDIVSLDSEGFFESSSYNYFVPRTTRSGEVEVYSLDQFSVSGGTTTRLPSIQLVETLVQVPNREFTRVVQNGTTSIMGVEFNTTPGMTSLKIVFGTSMQDAQQKLDALQNYNYNIRANARLSNAPLRALQGRQMVLLDKTGITTPAYGGVYLWDNTDELIFNTDTMKLTIITTRSTVAPFQPIGITNILEYDVVMTEIVSGTAGIFTLTGIGKYANTFGYLKVQPTPSGADPQAIYADFGVANTQAAAKTALLAVTATPTYAYEDINTAIRSYRLINTLDEVGSIWVRLNQDALGSMTYDPRNTEIFEFLSLTDRTLKYTIVQGNLSASSFYKAKIVDDVNTTNGAFQLIGYTDDTFSTINTSAIMHNRIVALDRGSELYKTQAKFGVGSSLSEAISRRNANALFNLHERSALPSNYRVISLMESFGDWVALQYPAPAGGTIPDPGIIPTGTAAGTSPTYDKQNTYIYRFDTSVNPELTVIDKTTGAASGAPRTYTLNPVEEISPDYAVFELRQKLSGGVGPNLDGLYMAVRVRPGLAASRGYIVFNSDPAVAKTDLEKYFNDTLYNYHAEETAPQKPSAIETIIGERYLSSQVTSGVPNGTYLPYEGQYISFTLTPLAMRVETVTASSTTPTVAEYALQTTEDLGKYAGIFQLSGQNLPLDGQFVRIDIQQGANEKQKIRLLYNADKAQLANGTVTAIANPNAFTVPETTHQIPSTINIPTPLFNIIAAEAPNVSSINPVDKMYDLFSFTNIIFNSTAKTAEITIKRNGVEITSATYNLAIMADVATGANPYSVFRLVGAGTFQGQFIAIKQSATPTIPNGGIIPITGAKWEKIVFANTFQSATNDLVTSSVDPYVTTLSMYSASVNEIFTALNPDTATAVGFGTPSFVQLHNGVYNNRNTEVWTFNFSQTNVTILDNNGITEIYNLLALGATSLSGGSQTGTFFLRSDKPSAPYKNKFVYVNLMPLNTAGSADAQATLNITIDDNRTVAIDPATPVTLEMRDLRSASVGSRAYSLALSTSKSWTLLNTTSYQKDENSFETWEFGYNNELKIQVTDQAGNAQVYNVSPREDTSSHRGVIRLMSATGTTSAKYHNTMVALGVGGETGTGLPYASSAFDGDSLRMGFSKISGNNLAAATTAAISSRDALPEWNMRTTPVANLPFNTLARLKTWSGSDATWVRLKANSLGQYEYDSTDTMSIQAVALAYANIAGGAKVQDLKISANTANADTAGRIYGAKLISALANGNSVEFQLFRNNDSSLPAAQQLSNKFVVLELGQGLNEGLMAIGIGDTLEAARTQYNNLNGLYNWAERNRVTGGYGTIDRLSAGHIWILDRKQSTDTSLIGSSDTTSGAGWIDLTPAGGGKPSYDPANNLSVLVDTSQDLVRISSTNTAQGNPTSFDYNLTKVRTYDANRGVYLLNGAGPYANRFIGVITEADFDPAAPSVGQAAAFVSGRSVSEVQNILLNTSFDPRRRNLFQIDWIKTSAAVFTIAAQRQDTGIANASDPRGAYVELGFTIPSKPNVYDPLIFKSYTIIPTSQTIGGITYPEKTIIISNRSPDLTRDDIYTYDVVYVDNTSGQDLRSVAILQGSGPEAGRYLGIRLPASGSSTEAAFITSASAVVAQQAIKSTTATIAPNETAGTEANNLYRYRLLSSVASQSRVINTLATLTASESYVQLDQDLIYVAADTSEWRFNLSTLLATTSYTKVGVPGISQGTVSTIPIKVPGETANKGVILLQDTTIADLDNKYMAVIVNGNNVSIRITNTLALATAYLSTVNPPVNFVAKSTVVYGDEAKFERYQTVGGVKGWGNLGLGANDFTYNPNSTQTWLVDTKYRIAAAINTTSASSSVTNYVRVKYIGGEADTTGSGQSFSRQNFGWEVISNSRTDIPFNDNTSWMSVPTGVAGGTTPFGGPATGTRVSLFNYYAIGIPNLPDVTGAYLGVDNSSLATAIQNREAGLDPKQVPIQILENNPQVLAALKQEQTDTSGRRFLPVKADGTINNAGVQNSPDSYAFQIVDRTLNTTPQVYDIRFNFIDSSGTLLSGANTGVYLTKILEDTSAVQGVVVPHGVNVANLNTAISNRYMAIQKGVVADETKVKVGYGTSVSEAQQALGALVFWNYRYSTVLDANTSMITNLADAGVLVYYDTPPASTPTYEAANTIDMIFDKTAGRENLIRYVVQNSITNQELYTIEMIERESATKAVMQLSGAGAWNQLFLAVDYTAGANTAKFAAEPTVQAAKDARDALTLANVYRKQDILSVGAAMNTVLAVYGDPTSVLAQGRLYIPFSPITFIYSARNTIHYTFRIDQGQLFGTITTIENNVVSSATYNMVLLRDETTAAHRKALYRLVSPGSPFDRQLMVVKIPRVTPFPGAQMAIGGLRFTQVGGTASGNVPTDETGIWDAIDDTTKVGDQSVRPLSSWNSEFTAVKNLENIGDIVTLVSGVYETNKTEILTFNETAKSLRITTNNLTYEYEIIIADQHTINGAASPTNLTIFLIPLDTRSAGQSQYADQSLRIRQATASKVIHAFGSSVNNAVTAFNLYNNTEATQPYGYWTGQPLQTAQINSDIIAILANAVRERTINATSDGTVNGSVIFETYSGLGFYADPRLYKSTTTAEINTHKPGTAAGTGTSRVPVGPNGYEQYGGFFDSTDFYLMNTAPVVNGPNSFSITLGNRTHYYNIKVLEYESPTRSVVQLLRARNTSGNLTAVPSSELRAMFENTIIAIDTGTLGADSDNFQFGYAKPTSASTTDLNAAIAEAKADRDARFTDLRRFIAAAAPYAFQKENVRAINAINNNIVKTFVNPNGFEAPVAAFDVGQQQLTFRLESPTENYYNGEVVFTASYKSLNNLNTTAANEQNVAASTRFLIRPIRTSGKSILLFRIMRPNSTTTVFAANNDWINKLQGQYIAMDAGAGAELLNSRMALGATPSEALENLTQQLYFNQSYVLVSSDFRRDNIDQWSRTTYNGNTPGVWVIKSQSAAIQSLTGRTFTASANELNIIFYKIGTQTYVLVKEGQTGSTAPFIPTASYLVIPKDLSIPSVGQFRGTFTLSGAGPLDNITFGFRRSTSNNTGKVRIATALTPAGLGDFISFSLGNAEYPTAAVNLKVPAYNANTAWFPFN